ncbi:hypothetical protein Hanom_Chr11g01022091 [Helianthus anomalus]
MYLERATWKKHRERLAAKTKLFEQAHIKLQEDRAAFDKEKKMRGMGHQGLKKKLQASEDLLAEERCNWRVAYDNENKKMFRSEADFKAKYKEAKSHRERVEVHLSVQIISKDRDLAGKDA